MFVPLTYHPHSRVFHQAQVIHSYCVTDYSIFCMSEQLPSSPFGYCNLGPCNSSGDPSAARPSLSILSAPTFVKVTLPPPKSGGDPVRFSAVHFYSQRPDLGKRSIAPSQFGRGSRPLRRLRQTPLCPLPIGRESRLLRVRLYSQYPVSYQTLYCEK